MKIAVNLSRLIPAASGAGGAGWFALTLCRALATRHDVTALSSRANHPYVIRTLHDTAQVSVRLLRQALLSETSSLVGEFDVYIDPLNGLEPEDIPPDVRSITVIHDLQFVEKPYFFSEKEVEFRRKHYGSAIDRADVVVTTSSHQRTLIQDLFHKESVEVIRQPAYFVANGEASRAATRYLIYPSVQWNHKNHFRLFQAFIHASDTGQLPKDISLLISGVLPVEANSTLHWELATPGSFSAAGRIEQIPYLGPRTFERALQGALGLVYPSLYEGYGLPVVESLASGLPVLTTRVPSLDGVDTNGNQIAYFRHPEDALSMSEDLANFVRSVRPRSVVGPTDTDTFQQFTTQALELVEAAARPARRRRRKPSSSNWPKVEHRAAGATVYVLCEQNNLSTQHQMIENWKATNSAPIDVVALVPFTAFDGNPTDQWPEIRRSYFGPDHRALDIVLAWELQLSRRKHALFVGSSSLEDLPVDLVAQSIEWLDLHPGAGGVRLISEDCSQDNFSAFTRHLLGALISVATLNPSFKDTPDTLLGRAIRTLPIAEDFLKPKFVVLDPSLKSSIGHHLLVARSMVRGALELSLTPYVFGNKDCPGNLMAGLPIVEPLFEDYLYGGCVDLGLFYHQLEHISERHGFTQKDTLSAFCATPAMLAGIVLFMMRRPLHQRPRVVIRFDRTEDRCPPAIIGYKECFDLIERAGLRQNLGLFVESKGLQSYFLQLCDEALPLIFNPAFLDYRALRNLGLVSPPQTNRRPAKCRAIVGILGEARLEKGFHLVPMILDHLLAKFGDSVRFEIQTSSGPLNTDERLQLTRTDLHRYAERHPNVHLHEYLSDGEYFEVFSSVDVLILPYSRDQYLVRGSGLASESLAAGCAVVTSHGIDIARTLAGSGVVEAADDTEEALLIACGKAIEDVNELLAKTHAYVQANPSLVVSEQQFVKMLISSGVATREKPRKLALWIANDTEGQGSGVVYESQLTYLKENGWLTIKLPVPYPAEWVLDQEFHFDWGVFIASLSQRPLFRTNDEIRRCIRQIAQDGNSYDRFIAAWKHLALPDALAEFLRSQVFDLAIVNYAHHAAVIDALKLTIRGPVIVETHDIQARQYAVQQARPENNLEVQSELERTAEFDHVVSISASEAVEFASQARPHQVSWVLPFCPVENTVGQGDASTIIEVGKAGGNYDMPLIVSDWSIEDAWITVRDAYLGEEFDILLVGSEHDANVHSMRWFLHNVYQPFLHRENFRVRIVGDVTTRLDREFLADRVEYLPRALSLDIHYNCARIVALPIVAGAGVPIKVLDAFARSKAFSMMDFPASALGLPKDFPLSSSAAGMAADISALLQSTDLRQARAHLGRRFYEQFASKSHYFSRWNGILDQATETYAKRMTALQSCVRPENDQVSA